MLIQAGVHGNNPAACVQAWIGVAFTARACIDVSPQSVRLGRGAQVALLLVPHDMQLCLVAWLAGWQAHGRCFSGQHVCHCCTAQTPLDRKLAAKSCMHNPIPGVCGSCHFGVCVFWGLVLFAGLAAGLLAGVSTQFI
jgi:hypothetical protein